MTYALNLHSDLSKLYLSKTGGKVLKKKQTSIRRGEKRTLSTVNENVNCAAAIDHHEGFLKD